MIAVAVVFAGVSYYKSDEVRVTKEATAVKTIPVEMAIEGGTVMKSNEKEGSTALDYLKNQTKVLTKGENTNAYVVSINGREADADKKEFWSFYVNGKMAEVGAGSYELKRGDKIEWKIETY